MFRDSEIDEILDDEHIGDEWHADPDFEVNNMKLTNPQLGEMGSFHKCKDSKTKHFCKSCMVGITHHTQKWCTLIALTTKYFCAL